MSGETENVAAPGKPGAVLMRWIYIMIYRKQYHKRIKGKIYNG